MLNKSIVIISLVCIFCSMKSFSQAIAYGYDNNGNRTSRTIYLGPQSKVNQHTDSTAVNDTVSVVTEAENNQPPIETNISDSKVTIYPNPVKYDLQVDLNDISNKNIVIITSDSYGKIIDKMVVTSNSNKIDFSQKARGIYYLKIAIDGKSDSWKIIKE